jgi:GNAT superfamily N-acetyltransferase
MPTIGPAADFIYYKGGHRTQEIQPAKLLQVYEHHTPEADAAIIEFWEAEKALPRYDHDFVLQRVSEVLFVVLNDENEIVGVCSGIPSYFEQIRNHFLYFRVFVRPDWRGLNRGVASSLFYATFDLFDQLKVINGQPIVGLLTVYESRHLNGVVDFYHSAQHRNQVFIGWTPRDEQIRVSYFNDVRMF